MLIRIRRCVCFLVLGNNFNSEVNSLLRIWSFIHLNVMKIPKRITTNFLRLLKNGICIGKFI